MMKNTLSVLVCLSVINLVLIPLYAQPSRAIEIAGNVIEAGTKQDITIVIDVGKDDPATFIPVTVINGSKDGPVLATVAGVHGYEFTSILATEKWVEQLNAKNLTGTLLIVRLAHISAFEERSIYVNPYDRKNLNRSFPGNSTGTQTERIAHSISEYIVANADFLIDLHSGDGAEWLTPFVGVYGGPLASGYEKAMDVAEHFGFPNIITYSMNTQLQIDRKRSLNRQGVANKIPTILVEIGENGSKKAEHVQALVRGLNTSLDRLGMHSNPLSKNNPKTNIRYFIGSQSVPANASGIWYPSNTVGRKITKGEALGEIKDYFGNTLEIVYAPINGYALYGLAGLPVKKGQSIMTIAKLR